jgi:hypothetical protein
VCITFILSFTDLIKRENLNLSNFLVE